MDILDENLGKGKSTSGVGVLDRSVAILSRLAEGPATLGEVVAGTGLPRPTAHRLLAALEKHHLVARRDGRYALGSRLLGWGNMVGGRPDLIEAARPVLVRLRDEVDESAQLYLREGDGRVCVAASERKTGLKTTVAVGSVLPLELGSAGKVLRGLPEVRERGWAGSVAEREAGVASVSAPVFGGDGELVAAVSVSGPISRLGERPGERLAEAVMAAARRIEGSL
ncbi:IclR family transcriptional regulator [Rubrobacter indicoceani]|uniref:IclR family transcriptional regulator n=1 Tax=Rubrobacter indicoceani TaxID=2051957 RepID=UPI000E5A9D62|nr:IclR family transcriptional regulator [Rubrobacter indicoceani]